MSNFGDLINIEEFDKKTHFIEERGKISFYCKECKKIIDATRPNTKGYVFICPKCEGKKIVIGTQEGLKANYRIK